MVTLKQQEMRKQKKKKTNSNENNETNENVDSRNNDNESDWIFNSNWIVVGLDNGSDTQEHIMDLNTNHVYCMCTICGIWERTLVGKSYFEYIWKVWRRDDKHHLM